MKFCVKYHSKQIWILVAISIARGAVMCGGTNICAIWNTLSEFAFNKMTYIAKHLPCFHQRNLCSIWLQRDTCHIDDVVQDCSISSALIVEVPQSYTQPSISCWVFLRFFHLLTLKWIVAFDDSWLLICKHYFTKILGHNITDSP